MEEKKGVLTEIIFHNEENGYTVGVFETEEEYFTCVGCIAEPRKGATYRLTGEFRVHPGYGEQFSFTACEEVMPEGTDEIRAFLASGTVKGIGPKTAALIVEKFGEDTLRIMEESPERLTEIPGIGEKKAKQIGESYAVRREFAGVSLHFQKYGITSDQAYKLYRAYGAEAVALIEENPYRLVDEVYGFGFKRADAIAEKLGIEKESPFRISSGITYALWFYAGEGSAYVPLDELCEKVSELLDVAPDKVRDMVVTMAFEGKVQLDTVAGVTSVYLFLFYEAEQRVCRNLHLIKNVRIKPLKADPDSMIAMTEREKGITLSERQKEAVKNSITGGFSVITGGPGTGKTTIINTIINIFEYSGLKTAIAAPTGRAAKRITETSGRYASTVHRLLEYYYNDATDEMVFGRNDENRLEYDAVIVDEASMIDILLMKALTDAIAPGTRFIMVGDADQLPSVGAGNVLADIIESDYANTSRLTEIFRQAGESLIVVNAHRINKGEYPSYNEKDKDFFFMERRREQDVSELIRDLVTRRLKTYYDDLDPVRDIQVLTPAKKGVLGSVALNRMLQEALNPSAPGVPEKKYGEKIFRAGDKVMQIRNNYQIGWKSRRDFSEGEGIFNGDVGFIQSIDKESGILSVMFDEDKIAEYDFSMLDELELAYAVTVHKSQGSEFPVVVMPVMWSPPVLATRNLLYTAVTRGKRAVVLCGSEERIRAMVDNNRISLRYSGLKSRLSDMLMREERDQE